MRNVRERLEVLYGDAALFDVTSRPAAHQSDLSLSSAHPDADHPAARAALAADARR